MNVIQCFASLCQGQDDMVQVRRLSHTMRGKMHSANKKLSMIRSKVMTMTVIKVINVDNTNDVLLVHGEVQQEAGAHCGHATEPGHQDLC